MSERHYDLAGGCRCGKVRYEAYGVPVYVPICHCESCRMATGAPVAVYVMFRKENVSLTRGAPKMYQSSPGARRGFCADCGTPLIWEGEWGGKSVVEVHIATLDNPEEFPPDRHVFYEERLAWFDVFDQLPRYNGSSTGVDPDGFGPLA